MTDVRPRRHSFGCYTQAEGAAKAFEMLWDNAIEFADMISKVQVLDMTARQALKHGNLYRTSMGTASW